MGSSYTFHDSSSITNNVCFKIIQDRKLAVFNFMYNITLMIFPDNALTTFHRNMPAAQYTTSSSQYY